MGIRAEVALNLQQACAADITALRDSTLALLGHADFERLLVLHPLALNKVFARTFFNHLRHACQIDLGHYQGMLIFSAFRVRRVRRTVLAPA
ncbi:hypothetical protein O4H66_02840 [Comamonadaceae bacterium G21597-S1]|nr:hypothetical protein [Comamonadaceae bacterium G21597-S1]